MILLFDVMHYAAGLLATLLKKTQVNKTFKNWVGSNDVGIQRQVFTISLFWAHLIKLLQRLQKKYRVPSSRFAQIYLHSEETQLSGTPVAEIVQIVVKMFNAQLFRHKY